MSSYVVRLTARQVISAVLFPYTRYVGVTSSAPQPSANTWYVFAYRYKNSSLASEIYRTDSALMTLAGASKYSLTGNNIMRNITYTAGGLNLGDSGAVGLGNMSIGSMHVYDRVLSDNELVDIINSQFY